jgi:hypothetical protein
MLYGGEAMEELHTGNDPLADADLASGEIVGEEQLG